MIEVSRAKWAADGFPGMAPGDLVNSSKPGHWLTAGITLFESLKSGRLATGRHTMRYRGQGLLFSQGLCKALTNPTWNW